MRSPFLVKKEPSLLKTVNDFHQLTVLVKELRALKTKMEQDDTTFQEKVGMTFDKVNEIIKKTHVMQKGDKGEKGDMPVAGVDYPLPKDGYTPVKGVDYFDGEPGVSPDPKAIVREILPLIPTPEKPDVEAVVKKVLELIRQPEHKDTLLDEDTLLAVLLRAFENKKLDWRKIPGLENEMASYRNQLAGKTYGKDTWARGGGDTVAAGTNVTITTNSDGSKVINATGGSGGVTIETPAGVVDASNTVFTPSAEPLYVIADGITYFDGAGYTWSSPTITMDVPPSQYIRDAIS